MSNGILLLSDESLKLLQIKHLKAKITNTEALVQGPKNSIHSVIFDDIDEELVLKATIKTNSGCEQSV